MSDLNLDRSLPNVDSSCFVAPGAIVIGSITLGAESSVWYQCVLRGDVYTITVGERTNLQDGTIVHADPGFPTVIGSDVTVGLGSIATLLFLWFMIWFIFLRGQFDSNAA